MGRRPHPWFSIQSGRPLRKPALLFYAWNFMKLNSFTLKKDNANRIYLARPHPSAQDYQKTEFMKNARIDKILLQARFPSLSH